MHLCTIYMEYRLKEHTHGFRILSAILLISEILAANISKYAAHAIRKDRGSVQRTQIAWCALIRERTYCSLAAQQSVLSLLWQAYPGRQ